ncbi:MAG: 30S ribosomal protein S20 [Legionellales bacterium]|nr:30S ribosomal protein S20 [Legionellales bacterium]
MANIKSSIKRARQNKKLRLHNASQRSSVRTSVKKILVAVNDKDYQQAMDAFKISQPIIDKAVSHGIIHINKAARIKSRINTKIKQLRA